MTRKDEETAWVFKLTIEHRDQPEVGQAQLDALLIASRAWAEERGLLVVGQYYGESELSSSSYKENSQYLRDEAQNICKKLRSGDITFPIEK